MDTKNVPTNVNYWKGLWNNWDVRIIVLSSLFLQTFLLFCGPLRKRTSKGFVTLLLWTAYLLLPVISTYGFGLITACLASPSDSYTDPTLLGLWSSFLLLHLSRPDTITAFSLEDNELWLRKSIHIAVYTYNVGQATSLSTSSNCNLWVPTYIVYMIGVYRYGGWVNSLLFSSRVGTDIYLPKRLWLTRVEESNELSDFQVLKHAFRLFTRFKGLIVDFSFTFDQCSESREFFIRMNPRDAFRVVERELNFFYEVIYTKAWILQARSAYLWRVVQFVALWVAFVFFYEEDKSKFKAGDTVITYSLLGGSIFLDASAMIMVLNSDWFAAYLRSCNRSLKQVEKCLTFLKSWWPKIVYRRWSNCLSQYNLMKYCLHPAKERSKDSDPIITMVFKTIESIRHVEELEFNEGIRDFILTELNMKSSIADNASIAREIQSAKGNWVLVNESCRHLLPWINGFDFDQSLLTWHVATDLCFHTDGDDSEVKAVRDLSKWLSDYMLYLLIWQPAMMSTVDARGEKRFKETCADVRYIFLEKKIKKKKAKELEVLKKASETILAHNIEVQPRISDKDEGLSVLMDAQNLAKKLKELGESRKWEVVSKVWVEMLCYAASHCKANAHMKQIQQGGQLITFVWLLMVHFGLVN